jgi:hypothetical protein
MRPRRGTKASCESGVTTMPDPGIYAGGMMPVSCVVRDFIFLTSLLPRLVTVCLRKDTTGSVDRRLRVYLLPAWGIFTSQTPLCKTQATAEFSTFLRVQRSGADNNFAKEL